MENFLSVFYPILFTFLTGFVAYLGKEAVKLTPIVIDYIVAKIGLANYEKTKAIAWDLWNVIEEHFRISEMVGDTAKAKIMMFETLIKQKIPGITDAEIETVRQAIAGEFNKNKPIIVKSIENKQ